MQTVLIVDDEPANRQLVYDVLSKKYSVLMAADGEEGRSIAFEKKPDLILLDVTMPKLDGITLCKELRTSENTKHIPIIMLTGMNDADTRIDSFMKGADDYLVKPFKPTELMARVMSKMRRIDEAKVESAPSQGPLQLECGNLKIDSEKMLIQVGENSVQLSTLEFELLKFFVMNKEKVLSREMILESVWKDSSVSDRTIDTHLVSIRKKLAGFDHVIRSIYGAGYVLKKP